MSPRQICLAISVLLLCLGFWPAVLGIPLALNLSPKCKSPVDTTK